jgi:Ubiquitin family
MEEGSIKLALKVETNLGPSISTEKSEAPKVSPVPTSDMNQIEFVVRLSTAKDFPISIAGTQTVGALKTQLIALSPDLKASKLLVLYLGKKLDDKVLLQDCRIKSKSIVQVMVL